MNIKDLVLNRLLITTTISWHLRLCTIKQVKRSASSWNRRLISKTLKFLDRSQILKVLSICMIWQHSLKKIRDPILAQYHQTMNKIESSRLIWNQTLYSNKSQPIFNPFCLRSKQKIFRMKKDFNSKLKLD